jgi:hypothetical protein
MMVVENLHRDDPLFGPTYWDLKTWSRELTLDGADGKEYTAVIYKSILHSINLIYKRTGDVITSQV